MSIRFEPERRVETHVRELIGSALVANAHFWRNSTPTATIRRAEDSVYFIQELGFIQTKQEEAIKSQEFALAMHRFFEAGKVLALDKYPGPNEWPIDKFVDGVSETVIRNGFDPDTAKKLIEAHAQKVSSWFDAIDDTYMMGVGEGSWNKTLKMNVNEAPEWVRTMLSSNGTHPSSAIVRIAKNNPTTHIDVRELFAEFVLMAYASRNGIGPRQHFAFVKLNPPYSRMNTIPNFDNVSISQYAESVGSIAEAFEGDCTKLRLNRKFALTPEEQREGVVYVDSVDYWSHVAQTIHRASNLGIVHGDIKRANMLFRLTPTGTIEKMVYTDFDPNFVYVLNMDHTPRIANCISWLMLFCYLNEIRCKSEDDELVDDANLEQMIQNALNAMKKLVPYDWSKTTLNTLCDLGVISNAPGARSSRSRTTAPVADQNVIASKEAIVVALTKHMENYWQRQPNEPMVPHNRRCLNPKSKFFRHGQYLSRVPEGTIDRLVMFALEGTEPLFARS